MELDGLVVDIVVVGSIVLFIDEVGWIFDVEGSLDFFDKVGCVVLMFGVCWDEILVGINVIGIVIVEGWLVEVCGGEYYFVLYGILICLVMLIFDLYG